MARKREPKVLPKAKPRAPLTKDRVLRAAIAVADETGIESLSMRKVGEVLGVEAMSLYSHVASKEEILDGIVDIVVGEIEIAFPKGDWKAAMRLRARSAHQVLLQHRWASLLIESRTNMGPARLRYFDAVIGRLREAGFSIEMAYNAFLAMDSYIYGFTLQEVSWPFDPEDRSEVVAVLRPQVSPDAYPHVTEIMQYVMGERRSEKGGYQAEFEFGLELILEGLDKFRSRNRGAKA